MYKTEKDKKKKTNTILKTNAYVQVGNRDRRLTANQYSTLRSRRNVRIVELALHLTWWMKVSENPIRPFSPEPVIEP